MDERLDFSSSSRLRSSSSLKFLISSSSLRVWSSKRFFSSSLLCSSIWRLMMDSSIFFRSATSDSFLTLLSSSCCALIFPASIGAEALLVGSWRLTDVEPLENIPTSTGFAILIFFLYSLICSLDMAMVGVLSSLSSIIASSIMASSIS